jgi:hypothetical protein
LEFQLPLFTYLKGGFSLEEIIHPNEIEIDFLNLAYNRFFDLYEEILDDKFWEHDNVYRLFRIKEIFSVYFELLKYPPLQLVIKGENRPNFSDVGKDLFKFVRNVLFHFPFFDNWNDIWVKKSLVNLYSTKSLFIDSFLSKFEGKEQIKYRIWEEKHKRMTYISISFPNGYSLNSKIYLKDMLTETDGVKFSIIFMNKILLSQVIDVKKH